MAVPSCSRDQEAQVNSHYQFLKAVNGSFNQGDARFGETAGRQCVCNSLVASVWSHLRNISFWNPWDLDTILIEGDKLYKSLGCDGFLSVHDIPNNVNIYGEVASIELLSDITRVHSSDDPLHLDLGKQDICIGSGILFFIRSACCFILFRKRVIFLFDPHSRDAQGRVAHNGFSVLLRFGNLHEVEKYIVQIHGALNSEDFVPYEVNCLRVTISAEARSSLQNSINAFRLAHNRQRQNKRTLDTTMDVKSKNFKHIPNHKHTEEQISVANDVENRSKTTNNTEERQASMVAHFKAHICEGPFYICCICNRTMYKRAVLLYKEQQYNVPSDVLSVGKTVSFDGRFYICKTCHQKLQKKKVPCQSVWNDLICPVIPDELKVLKNLERILIAKRIPFKKIVIMPEEQSPKMKGAICNLPLEYSDVCNALPRNDHNSGVLFLKLKRKLAYKGHVYFEPVRPSFIEVALHFLKANNPFYSDAVIDLTGVSQNCLDFRDPFDNDGRNTFFSENTPLANNAMQTCIAPLDIEDDMQNVVC